MKITVDIFSGFLGSGKTMLIKKMLLEKAYNKNTVIIENEFGDVSIDGEILRESNIEVKEINSGCICCQVSGRFDDAVLEVINKYKPESIIIEPSGVAKLSEIINILTNIKFSHMIELRNIFTLVDVRNFDNYVKNFKEFYVNQLKNAHKIVLSRTQFEDKDNVGRVMNCIKEYNPDSEIIYKPWDKLKASDFMKYTENIGMKNNRKKNLTRRINSFSLKKHEDNHSADDIFESFPITMDKFISADELRSKFEFICKTKDYGNIIRAKGIIESNFGKYYQFDYVPAEFKIREIRWSNKKVISIIGSDLNKSNLNKLFS
ncbi:GTP-binding protein [uncultured Clostridium sp.]|uniref:GTP-binding protein n=1 Tax=uncultured Clostridium sp. TaxID=59620 RepID=UPI0025E0FC49|nr:GTP-binding protein [uncultured Clostridium sp.]